jgi:hypothetical protein
MIQLFRTHHLPPFQSVLQRCDSSVAAPPRSRTSRIKPSTYSKELKEILSRIPDNQTDSQDENQESIDEPLWQPSIIAMGKRPSHDSFMSKL